MNTVNIPNYRLYGEGGARADVEFVHCESIPERSVLHDWNIRPHRHDSLYQLLFMSHGSARIMLEGGARDLRSPCLVMIPPMVVHGYEFQRDVDGMVITIAESAVERILAMVPKLAPHLATPPGGAGRICALQSHLGLAFVMLARTIARENERQLSIADKSVDLARNFRGRVDRHFKDHWTVAAHASALAITPTHLNRICRKVLGRSALEVIHERLLLEAKRNLIYTSMTVKEVSNALCFSDPAYFTRFFAKKAGQSPTAFREARRGGREPGPDIENMLS
ncbi:MAG: helix-turn-helix domain-containing protein [Alphaproteobacteria bacterium]|nr:helix-turn-helix domain-containing protein [Alphaproteobacteria bacterium]